MTLKFKSTTTIGLEYNKYGSDYLGGIPKAHILFMARNYPIVHVSDIHDCGDHKWYLTDTQDDWYLWPEWLFEEVTEDEN